MSWEVQECVDEKWVPLWTDAKLEPVRFDTKQEAEVELEDFIAEMGEAVEDGFMDSDGFNKDDYRVLETSVSIHVLNKNTT